MARKILVPILIVSLILTFAVTAFADPSYITSTAYGLIVVTNPEYDTVSTTDTSYVISGYGNSGVHIVLYKYDSDGNYYPLYVDGNLAECWIGDSGLFMQRIPLYNGKTA